MSSRYPMDETGPIPNKVGVELVDGLSAESLGGINGKALAQQIEEPPDFTQRGDGRIDIKGLGPLTAAKLQKYMTLGAQTQNYLEQLAKQAMRKKEVLEKNPLLSSIGRASSAIAAQYAAPGSRGQAIVRGLGAFGADFFQDTPESLIQRAAAASSEAMEVEGRIHGALVNEEKERRQWIMEKRRADTEERLTKQGQERLDLERAEQKRKAQDSVFGVYETTAKDKRTDTSEAFRAEAQTRPDLFTPSEIEAKAKSLKILGEASARAWDQEQRVRLGMHLTEINARRIEAARDRGMASMNARTDRILGRIDKIENEKKAIREDFMTAKSYFTDMANDLGLPPPTTQAEAQKIMAAYRKDPRFGERWRSVSEMAPRRLAQLDTSHIETLTKQQAIYESQLPPELRPGIDKPPTPEEIKPKPGAPPTPLELEAIAMKKRGEIDEPRFRAMIAALEAGVVPDELKVETEEKPSGPKQGPIKTFEKWVEGWGTKKKAAKVQPVLRQAR